MSGSNLSVKITADVVDLQTKFGIAKAEAAGLSAELNKLNRSAAAGNLSILPGAMQQLVGDFAAAKTQANSLGVALGEASGGILGITAAAEHGHGSISTATREFRALFDEISSGRTRQSPGTIAILLQRVAGLGPASLGAVGGVLALVGGLGYLTVKSIEASNAMQRMKIAADTAGNFDLTEHALQAMTQQLEQSTHISGSAARTIAADLASIPGMVGPAAEAGAAMVARFMGAFNVEADKAGQELKKFLEPSVSAEQAASGLAKMGAAITEVQREAAAAVDRTGNAHQILAEKMQLIDEIASQSRVTQQALDSSRTASGRNFLAAMAMEEQGLDATSELLQSNVQLWDQQSASINKSLTALRAMAATPSQNIEAGLAAGGKANPQAKEMQDLQGDIAKIQRGLADAQAIGDQFNLDRLKADLGFAQEKLQDLKFGPALEKMRADIAAVAATWDGSQTGMLAKQIAIGQATLADVQKNSKEYLSIQTEVSRLEVQEHQASSQQVIAGARQRVAEIGAIESQSALSRAAQEHAIWEGALADARLTSAGRIEVERDVATASTAIQRAAANEQATISRQNIATNISISRLQIEAEKNALDLGTAANAAAVAQKLSQLRLLTATEFTEIEQQKENELSALQGMPAEYNRVYNEIRELKAKLVIDLQNLDKEAAEASKKYTKEQASQWHGIVGEIEGAESGMVSDLLTKRKSLAQSLEQVGAQLVEKEIANDLRAMTTRVLLQKEGDVQVQALKEGGLLYHVGIEIQKELATMRSQGAQTGAVIAGDQARVTAEASGAAQSKAIQGAIGGPQVMADAAKGAAGAYSALAGIPIVGPVLGAAAAGVTFAAIAAYQGMASLDTGTNYVPRNMVAQIHEGEAIVPKAYNPAAQGGRAQGGGDYHEQHNYGDVHVNAVDTRGFVSLLNARGNQRALANTLRNYVSRGGGRR